MMGTAASTADRRRRPVDPTPMRIDGAAVATGEHREVRSPFDGRVVGRVPAGGAEHVEAAVAVASARHRAGPPPAWERAQVLDRAADAIAARREELARSISDESAKPIAV